MPTTPVLDLVPRLNRGENLIQFSVAHCGLPRPFAKHGKRPATRPTRPDRLPHQTAAGLVVAWTRFKVQAMTLPILAGALEITAAHGLSYWDSAVVAAARALGCAELFSEDLPHGREVDGVRIVDPFR